MKLFADVMSQPSRALMILLADAGIKYEFVECRIGEMAHKTKLKGVADVRKLPVLVDDDGFVLYESHAMLKYLFNTRKVAPHWYPRDAKTRAEVDKVLDWHHTNLRPGSAGLVFCQVLAPMMGKEVPEFRQKEVARQLASSLKRMDKWLEKSGYIAGTKKPTLADLSLACEAEQTAMVGYSLSDYSNVVAWLKRMRTIPAYTQVHKPFDKLAGRMASMAQSRL